MEGEKTTLTRASPKTESLRTTVPISIVKQFGLKDGDEIYWRLDIEDNNFVIKVKPNKK
jgi:bifunctional DNA-binding transcriptional regulator/antitoxin component of YhaV-PrlF toxin-antitoxin module